MKLIVLFWLLHKAFIASDSVNDSCGNRVKFGKEWLFLCFSNPDQSLKVVFDCVLDQSEWVSLSVRGESYPENMESLTIQNCQNLTLMLERWSMSNIKQSQLHLSNISLLDLHDGPNRCLPQKVIFENIRNINFEFPLISNVEDCQENGMILESIEMINVTIKQLNSNFIWKSTTEPSSLKQLIMNNVTIENAQSDSIYINNEKCVINIINSTIGRTENNFIDGNVSEIIISNSILKGFTKKKSLRIKADKVLFTGNQIELLSDDSLDITSNTIEIVDNVFHHIEANAFRNIIFLNDVPPRSYNFSNNVIYSIAPNTLTVPFQNTNQKVSQDNIKICSNLINCSCSNMHWFDSMVRKHDDSSRYYYYYYKWSKKSNSNKCLNIPNCDISQVLKNYVELCEDDYECSGVENTTNTTENENLKRIERLLMNMEDYNIERLQNFSKFFDDIIDKMEEDRTVENCTETIVDEKTEKAILWLLGDFDKIKLSAYILISLLLVIIAYLLISKLITSGFIRKLINKCKVKSYLTETEMNQNSISDSC